MISGSKSRETGRDPTLGHFLIRICAHIDPCGVFLLALVGIGLFPSFIEQSCVVTREAHLILTLPSLSKRARAYGLQASPRR